MKRLILLFLLFLFVLPCFAMELKTFDIRETYFNKEYKSVPKAGKIVKELDYFSFKGVWIDPKKLSTRLMQEELFCSLSSMECMSGFAEIDIWRGKIAPPIYDVYFLIYKIIDVDSKKVKLYNTITEYNIEIDLTNKTATKYKVFENGDINKYNMTFDYEQAKQYFKSIISE